MQAHQPLAVVEAPGVVSSMRQEYHQKVELEKACLEEAGWCFTQAKQTPLLSLPLVNIFSKFSNNKAITRILSGEDFLPALSDQYAAKFLAVMPGPPGLEDMTPRSNLAYGWGWQKAWETAGSLASGIHFGHYIAGTYNLEILVVNVNLANIPLRTGLSYNWWKKD